MSDEEEPKPSEEILHVKADVEHTSPPHGIDAIVPETNDIDKKDPKSRNEEKNFSSIEGELLDFEDFNEKLPDIEQSIDSKNTESEDGQCDTPEKKSSDEKDEAIEEGEDEGVCSGEEDLEEGEISSEKKENSQAVCRFFHRGMCFYGSACRFLHPNDKKGNYNMFDTSPRVYGDSFARMGQGMSHRRQVQFLPTPPPPAYEIESAWERGLKEAKVLLKQANKRKDEPDFEEKRLNLSLASRKHSELDKENDASPRRERRKHSSEARHRFKYQDMNNYNNDFDVYSKESYMPMQEEEEKDTRGPSRFRKSYDRFSRSPRHRWNCSRYDESKMQRSDQAQKFFDPWQRSRSPLRNRSSRSVSCSPVSSYSCSSRSSRSYSRSSSRSSYNSSRKTSSSRSRSRSRSRSISMDSVSSASSRNSSGSHSSGPPKQGSAHMSHRKARPMTGRSDAPSALYPKSPPAVKVKASSLDVKREVLEEPLHYKPLDISSIPSFQHLVPDIPERTREPVRGLHKQSIKLTLLNKNLQPKVHNLPKKDLHVVKKQEEPAKTNPQQGVKRPLSPPTPTKPAPPVAAKRTASSRRDDLLKQLKAVEDAIARKRAK